MGGCEGWEAWGRWFELRDERLVRVYEADREMWKDLEVGGALVEAILVRKRVPRDSSKE